MLANAPTGKVSEALAQICTKEDISLEQGKDFTPIVISAPEEHHEALRHGGGIGDRLDRPGAQNTALENLNLTACRHAQPFSVVLQSQFGGKLLRI